MKKLFSYLGKYKKESILAPLFKMFEASLDLLVPFIVANIINVGISSGDTGYILRFCGLLVILALVGLACSVSAQFFAAKAAVGCAADMRRSLFRHIETLGFAEMDKIGTDTLITRMTSDINQVQSGMNLFLRLFLRSPFIVFGAMIMAFTIDTEVAMIFVLAIPVLAIIVFGIMLLTMPLYKKVQSRLDSVLGITRENLSGVRVIRAFNKQDAEVARFREANGGLNKMQLFVGRISALMNPLTFLIINLAIIAILNTGAVKVNTGAMLPGNVIALISYMTQILVELIKFADLIIQVTKALACAERVQGVMNITPDMKFPENSSTETKNYENVVEFNNVGLRYNGAGEESLQDINFSVKRGETIGVIGSTGSGKTSLVNLIPRFYEATSGAISVFGKPAASWTKEELRGKIGLVSQKAQLFSGTIRSNLLWGNANADDSELWEALEAAQSAEFVRAKKLGLDEPVDQGGRNLSGGQKQRLTIARALVKKPEILILDDSASALDFATDAALRKSLSAIPGNMTVFIVSQRASSLRHAQKILVLDDGELVGQGTHDQLLEDCGVYQEIYESQFKKGGEH